MPIEDGEDFCVDLLREFRTTICAFRTVWLFFSALTVLSVMFTLVSASFPFMLQLLCVSADNPWGVVTGIFVHLSSEHLLNNLFGTIALLSAFTCLNTPFSFESRSVKAKSLVIIVFAIAVFTNIIGLMLAPQVKAAGASRLTFAISGALLAEAYKNILLTVYAPVRPRGLAFFAFLVLNLYASIFLTACALLDTTDFFIINEKVDFFAHTFSFLLGMFCYSTYSLCQNKEAIT